MERLTLQGIWDLIMRSRNKILLIGAIFAIAVAPAIYLLAPAKYSIQTSISIPYDGVKVENYEILIRRTVVKQVCRKLVVDSSPEAVAEINRHLSIAIDEDKKMVHLGYIGSDAASVTEIGTEMGLQTLRESRDERIANLRESIRLKEKRITVIDDLMDDKFIARYYDNLYRQWLRLLSEEKEGALNVFLDVDPMIKDLYLEKKTLTKEITDTRKYISELRKHDNEYFEKHFTPLYQPEKREPPRLLLVIFASAVLGLLFGLLWVFVSNYGIKKGKKEGI
ncbi:MAG: hypothetical protein GX878_07380 [Firmicutes bacterium]|nr:hypothetical protein [Bacillota bacterium]